MSQYGTFYCRLYLNSYCLWFSEVADPADEEGEVDNEDRDKYEIKKIISYSGYNVPPPKDVVDVS